MTTVTTLSVLDSSNTIQTINTGLNPGQANVANSTPIVIAGDHTRSFSNTPTVNTSAYASNNQLGGLMTFPSVVTTSGYGMILNSIKVSSKSVQSCGIKFYFFNQNPTNSTWTDHTNPSINASDIPFLWGEYTLGAPDSGLGTHTVWNLDGIGLSCNVATTNVYAVMVVAGTPTFTSTSDVSVSIGVLI